MLVTSYHETAFTRRRRKAAVSRIVKALKKYPKNVGLAFTGLSGTIVGTFAADRTGRQFAIVRKPGEESHGDTIEGYTLNKYVIIDDFIETGSTILRIMRQLEKYKLIDQRTPECVGILLYTKSGDVSLEHFTYQGKQIKIEYCW